MIEHNFELTEEEDGSIKITCSCGNYTTLATEYRFVNSLIQRHSLHEEVWPYEKPPFPGRPNQSAAWPHNTMEDAEKDKNA